MRAIHWLLHMFGCPDEEIEPDNRYNGYIGICKKCGRTSYLFRSAK